MKSEEKGKPVISMIIYGVVVTGLYIALLKNQDLISGMFTRGGVYAMLPIITAFIFSIAHGNFTGNFWTVLGVEASKNVKGGK